MRFDSCDPNTYQIRIKGLLGDQWSDWFDKLTINRESDGTTTLTGEIIDDAALHGLLKKVRDLGMPLFSVNRIEPDLQDKTKSNSEGGASID